jgi:hypothetical protein
MSDLTPVPVICPYCGSSFELLIDRSAGNQEYSEDCQVCCEPMNVSVILTEEGWPIVDARQEG